jgi:hypothetical protein
VALQPGDASASAGMSLTIYTHINDVLKDSVPPKTLPDAQASWKKLAFAIASGVIEHLKTNMEISGIQGTASPSLTVAGTSPSGAVTGTATGSVTTTQSGPFTGHVA